MRIFVPIFFLSGVAGLGYQVVWAKSFAAAIGHEFPAVLAVVTAFMSGMAAGNLLFARTTKYDPRWYGWLEIVIGAWGVATIFLTPLLQRAVIALLGINSSAGFHWTVVFLAVLAALFPATAAMGATLPAAERFLFAAAQRQTTGLLYGANTAGAMLGALLAAFWLMPRLGIRGSIWILAGVNFVCGFAALGLARNPVRSTAWPRGDGHIPRRIAAQLFLAGLLGIGFELVIVRALAHLLENTVYTFAVVLAVYLAGNAVGALVFHRFQGARIFGNGAVLFGALSASCVAAGVALRWMPLPYQWLRFNLGDSLAAVALAETMIASALFLLPAIGMGATWSWLAQGTLRHRPNLAWGAAINLLGAAAAPIVFGLLVVPAIGLKGALAAIPFTYALLGGKNRATGVAVLLATGAMPLMTSTRDLIDTAGQKVISLNEGVMGSVAVLENASGARVLKFNNRFQMGGTAAHIAEERQADIPLLLHPGPKRALFIGLGTGITFATAANYPNLRADSVELAPEIAAAMPLFDESGALRSTNLHLHIADGRRFVRASKEHYDVIVADLFYPAQDGAGFLYTREHFTAIRERLTPGGLFCQWLPLYQIDSSTLRIIAHTFGTVFRDGQRWLLRFDIDTPVIGLIAWNQGGYRTGIVERRMDEDAKFAEHLRRVGLTDSIRLFGGYIGEITPPGDGAHARLNTDAHPIVIFRAPEITFDRKDDPARRLLEAIEFFPGHIGNLPWRAGETREFNPRIEKFIEARNIYLRGLVRKSEGEVSSAVAAFIESAKVSADFTAGYAQALALAAALAESEPESARAILEALTAAQPERPVARELLERLQPK